MILTMEQERAIQKGRVVTVNIGGADCVVLRKDLFDQGEILDYTPWTTLEMDLLAGEAADLVAGDGLDELDPS